MTDSVSLSSLRVQAELDASKYTAGAQAKVAADQQMVASDTTLGASMEQTDRRLVSRASGIESLRKTYVDGYRDQTTFDTGLKRLNASLEANATTGAEAAIILDGLVKKHGVATTSADVAAKGYTTLAQVMRDNGRAAVGVAGDLEALAASHGHVTGQSAKMREGMVLVHEFLSGNYKRAIGSATIELQNFGVMGLLLNPIALGFGAIAAAGIAVAIKMAEISSQTRQLTVELKGMGDVAQYSASQLQGIVGNVVEQGASRSEAVAAVSEIVRRRTLQGSAIPAIATLAPNVAAGTGSSTPQAAAQVADALSKGYDGIKKLDQAWGFLTETELASIRAMAQHGDVAGQLDTALAALQRRFGGLGRESMSDFKSALHDLGIAYDNFVEELAKKPVVIAVAKAGAQLLKDLTPGSTLNAQIAQNYTDLVANQGRLEDLKSGKTGGFFSRGAEIDQAEARVRELLAEQKSLFTQSAQQQAGAGVNDNRYGLSTSFIGPPAPPKVIDNAAQLAGAKEVAELAKTNETLAAAYQKVGVARELAVAKIAAEKEAEGDLGKTANLTALIQERQVAIRIRLAGAAAEVAAKTKIETEQTLLVADAYLQSEAAGARAEAIRQATIEAVSTGVPVAIRAQQLLAEATAKTADAGAKQVPILERQASEARRVADAANISIAAQHAAEVQNKIDEATLAQRIALENADVDTKARLAVEIERITAAIKKQDEAQLSTALSEATRQQKDQLQLGQAELSLIGANAQERAVLLARIQAEIQLRHMNRDAASEEGQAFIANAEALAKQSLEMQRQNEALQEIADFGGKAFDAVAQAMANSGNQTIHFRDILGSLKTEFELLILRMGVLNTLKNAFLGTNLPTLFNLGSVLFEGGGGGSVGAGASLAGGASAVGNLVGVGSAGAGSGAAGSFGLSSLFNIGGLANSVSGLLGGPTLFGAGGVGLSGGINALGSATGIFGGVEAAAPSAAFIGPMPATSGLLGSTTLTGFASGVGLGFGAGTLINSLAGGNQTNGMIGSAGGALAGAAIGSIIPGVGTIIGGLIGGAAGGGFGGLFGPGLPNNSAGFNLNTATGAEGFTNKGTRNLSAAQGLQGSIDSIIGTLTSSTGGHLSPQTITGDVSNKIGTRLMTFDQVTGQPTNTFTGASALSDFADLLMHSLVGLDAETQKIVDHTQHYVELSGNLQFLTMFDSLSKLQPLTTQAADAFAAISKQFDDVSAKARGFDLDIAKLAGGFAANFNQSVAQSIEQIENPLQYALDQEKLTADARRATAEKLGADLVQVDRLTADERQAIQQQYLGNLKAQLHQLIFGNASTLTGTQQYQAASASFAAAEAQTAAGHAPGNLGDVVNQFVASSRAVNASGPQYAADFARATASLQVATGGGSPEMTALATQIGALGGVIAKLGVDLPASNDRWSALEGQVVELQAQVVRLLAKVA